jgi:hypothetical protein
MIAAEAAIQCSDCRKERAVKLTPKQEPRTPTGWKKQSQDYYCDTCWGKRYVLRAIAIPVASPLDCSREELRQALKLMWTQTTACANRIMTECYARDVRRTGMESKKMPSMQRVYLYPELRAEFPALPSQTVASLEHAVVAKYRAIRYPIIWTGSAALPTYRYPTPFPIAAQAWHARIEQDKPIVSLRIGERRLQLRLKNGPQFRRQYAVFGLIALGEAVSGEAAVYQRGFGSALIVKLVAWLPRQAAQEANGVLNVHTAADSLLVAVNAEDKILWRYHGDHLRRWAAERRRVLQRWSDDSKYENRPMPAFEERRAVAARKFRDRMDSATHEIAAQLAGYAQRRRFARVEYDDHERGFCTDFPYFRLSSLIAEKLDARGISFGAKSATAGSEVQGKSSEPLAEK